MTDKGGEDNPLDSGTRDYVSDSVGDGNLGDVRRLGAIRDLGDVIEIPIVEEELVVIKRPVVKEVLRIRKRWVTEQRTVEEVLRKEDVEIVREGDVIVNENVDRD